jgi:hypothetical protein
MSKASKKQGIRQKATVLRPVPRRTWFDTLSSSQKAEMLDLKEGWRAGEISAPVAVIRRELVVELLGDKCPTAPTLSRWLNESDG